MNNIYIYIYIYIFFFDPPQKAHVNNGEAQQPCIDLMFLMKHNSSTSIYDEWWNE